MTDFCHGTHKRLFDVVLVNTIHEVAIDLDKVRLQLRPELKTRVSGAQIIDSEAEAIAFEFGGDVQQCRDVGGVITLGYFNHNAGSIQPGLFKVMHQLVQPIAQIQQGDRADIEEQITGQVECQEAHHCRTHAE